MHVLMRPLFGVSETAGRIVLKAARADERARFSYLGNGWTDGAEIWYVVKRPIS